jgi:hypothetical protein
MPSIADAVARILTAAHPVLFADTCTLLDVIRAPLRPVDLAGCVEAAQELARLATTSPTQCTLVVASFVPGEWRTHADSQVESVRIHVAEIDEETKRLHGFCDVVGTSPPFPIVEYGPLSLANGLEDLSRRLLDGALHLEPDPACVLRAYERATNYVPPSLKGGEVKDSTILEECLEVSRRLQSAGFSPKRIFCTSNKSDYCAKGSSRLHPTLAADFLAAGLDIATSLPWAVNAIRNP